MFSSKNQVQRKGSSAGVNQLSPMMIVRSWQASRGPRAWTTLPGHCPRRSAGPHGCAKGNRRLARPRAFEGKDRAPDGRWQPEPGGPGALVLPQDSEGNPQRSGEGGRGELVGRAPRVLSEGINLSAASQGAQHQGGCGAVVLGVWVLLAGGALTPLSWQEHGSDHAALASCRHGAARASRRWQAGQPR